MGKFADIAIGSVAIEGVPEALSVEHAVVASTTVSTRIELRRIPEE